MHNRVAEVTVEIQGQLLPYERSDVFHWEDEQILNVWCVTRCLILLLLLPSSQDSCYWNFWLISCEMYYYVSAVCLKTANLFRVVIIAPPTSWGSLWLHSSLVFVVKPVDIMWPKFCYLTSKILLLSTCPKICWRLQYPLVSSTGKIPLI